MFKQLTAVLLLLLALCAIAAAQDGFTFTYQTRAFVANGGSVSMQFSGPAGNLQRIAAPEDESAYSLGSQYAVTLVQNDAGMLVCRSQTTLGNGKASVNLGSETGQGDANFQVPTADAKTFCVLGKKYDVRLSQQQ